MSSAGLEYICPQCETILQSMYRHDFVSCDCANQCFVDGGDSYTRCGAMFAMPVLLEDYLKGNTECVEIRTA